MFILYVCLLFFLLIIFKNISVELVFINNKFYDVLYSG